MPSVATQSLSAGDRIAGAIYGHLCGDAFGVPYEFHSPSQLPRELKWGAIGTHAQPPGTWSDDGALMLCHVASFAELGGFVADDAGRRFVRWSREGYMAAGGVVFDIGNTTNVAIGRINTGTPATQAGPDGESHNGNGSLMRVLPVALWFANAGPDELIMACHEASRITHGHARSQTCCAVYGIIISSLLNGAPPKEVWAAALKWVNIVYRDRLKEEKALIDELDLIRQFRDCAGRGYVVDTLVSAWQCFEASSGYVETIERAVRLGHDTDTTAAVAGSFAGAWWGVDGVPRAWREDLRLTPDIKSTIDKFVSSRPGERPFDVGRIEDGGL